MASSVNTVFEKVKQEVPGVGLAAGAGAVAGAVGAKAISEDPRAGAAFGAAFGFVWSTLNALADHLITVPDTPAAIVARLALPLIFGSVAGVAVCAALGFPLCLSSVIILSGCSMVPVAALSIYFIAATVYSHIKTNTA